MNKRLTLAALVFILGIFLFTACSEGNEPNEQTTGETSALAGFIEIRDGTLYIIPVEVFMLYEMDGEPGVFPDPALRSIIHINRNDSQKLAEYGLIIYDFPSWAHIRPNWHNEYHWHYVEQSGIEQLAFAITPDTDFIFIDSERNLRNTNVVEDFLPYLFPTVVHFIEVYNGEAIRLVQEFGFTM